MSRRHRNSVIVKLVLYAFLEVRHGRSKLRYVWYRVTCIERLYRILKHIYAGIDE